MRTYGKVMRRGVKATLTRFLSILGISALGVGFLCGLLSTTPDMQLTVDEYYDEYALFDIDIRGGLGMTDADAEALLAQDCVEAVMPACVTDREMLSGVQNYVTRIYGVDFSGEHGTAMNGFELLQGRMPQNASECVITSPDGYTASHSVGDVFSFSKEAEDYADLPDTYNGYSLTVVGIVRSPSFISIEREPSTVGAGSVDVVLYVPAEFYAMDVYTDIFLTVRGAKNLAAFDGEYTDAVDAAADKLETLGVERSQIRYDEVVADARSELADGWDEYNDAAADAEKELADARRELDDGWTEYNDGLAELADARRDIADGESELRRSQTTLNSSIAAQKSGLMDTIRAAAQPAYDDALAQIESARADAQSRIDAARADAQGQIDAARADGMGQIDAAFAGPQGQIDAARAEALAQIESARAAAQGQIDAQQAQLDAGRDMMTPEQIAGAEAAIASAQAELDANIAAQKDALEAQLAPQQQALDAARAEQEANLDAQIAPRQAELDAAIAAQQTELDTQIAAQVDALDSAFQTRLDEQYATYLAQIESARASAQSQINSGWADIAEAREELADGEQELADALIELNDGEAEYLDGKSEADTELADARKELADGQADIDDIDLPEWYITDRGDTVSYSSYKSNSEKVAAIAKVFPVFFFVVAVLVALTTMTRMVEEERLQIGTLKALGYSKGRILEYYLLYSLLASLTGGAIGCALGFNIFPVVIANAYSMMYILPPTVTKFYWSYAIFTIGAMAACSVGATLWACMSQLMEKPSALLLPKAQASGKKILLEKIPFIWKRLSFTRKVTARNIFRYKKRLYMTVIGIAGCCALLVAAFGIRVSVRAIVDKQYGELYLYNLTLYLDTDSATESDAVLADALSGGNVQSVALMHSASATVESGAKSAKLTLMVPRDTETLKENIVLRERKSGADIPFDEDAFILTEKFCEQNGIKTGDTVTLIDGDGRRAEFTVTGVAENYVTSYAFLSSSAWERAFGGAPEYKTALVKTTAATDAERAALSGSILKSDAVLMTSFSDTIRQSFSNSVKSIDYIVMVLIVCAGILAMIVLYNLTNINICERRKELATIKVLGFHEKEVAGYVYRETTVLCLIGIAVGLLLGIELHAFVVRAAEVDAVMFGRTLTASSYACAAAVTAAFTALVDVLMLPKLKNISMVESMKAPE